MTFPHIVIDIAKEVKKLPKKYSTPARALLVGGFVRDYLLGIESKDTDIEVYGVDYADLKKLLTKLYPSKIDEKGKAFGVITIHFNEYDIDVALPRVETKTGRGYYGFEIKVNPDLAVKQAASRRDFTINAILLDPLTKKIIDPFKGQLDLKKKNLRAVNPKTFGEDPLRVYRGIQFTGRFNLHVDPKTLKLMKKIVDSGELKTLPKKRINTELNKLKTSRYRGKGLQLITKLGL